MSYAQVCMSYVQVYTIICTGVHDHVYMPYVQMYMPYVQMYMSYVQVYMSYVQMYMSYVQVYIITVQVYMIIWGCLAVSTDILLDMVGKLESPKVALVHQMPYCTDQQGLAASIEKVSLQCHDHV